MKKGMMLAVVGLAAGAVGGCLGDATGPAACDPIESTRVAVRGDTVVTSAGLRYIEVTAGTGAAAEWCQLVAPRITGMLTDGTIFQPTTQFAFRPGLDPVIPGFAEGVVGIRSGGVRRLIIPPELGYGSEPVLDPRTNQVVVPANSTLIFDVAFPGASNP